MTMITPSYLGETIEYSSLHACRSTLEDPTTIYSGTPVHSNQATTTVTAVPPPPITLTKVANPTSYDHVGQVIAYTYTVTNAGTAAFTAPVTIADDKTTVTCPSTLLAPGASETCTATYTITQADLDAGHVTNHAIASTVYNGNPVTSNPATTTVTAVKSPAISLTKTANPTTYDHVGQVIAYTYMVKNTGNVTLTAPVTIADDKTTVTCPATLLAPGASVTCSATYSIMQADLDAGKVTNHALATTIYNGSPVNSNPATATVTATQSPAIALTKAANPTTYFQAGQVIAYTYMVTNTGNVTLTAPVTIADDKTTVTCPATLLAPGASETCTATYTITQADVTAGHVTNHATATTTYNGSPVNSNQATTTVTAVPPPPISLTKAANPTTYDHVGQVIAYTYTVTNTGTLSFTAPVTVSDDKTTVTCPSTLLAAGASEMCTATYTITQADLDAGHVTNHATATTVYNGSPVTSGPATTTVTAVQSPSLSLTKTPNPTTYDHVGQTITYTYTVTNTGNVTLTAPVTVTDDKTTVTCPATLLAPGASVTCSATYTITQADLDAGHVTNHATAKTTFSGSPVNSNQATTTVTATQSPSLSLVKTANPMTYDHVGQVITYTYVVKNTGNVTFTAPVTIADNKTTVTCPSTLLAPGASLTCSATYTITQADLDAGHVTNAATASTTFSGQPVHSNQSTVTVTATQSPSLSLAKSANPTTYSAAGQTITYSYVVKNTGNVTFTAPVTLADDKTKVTCPSTLLAPGASETCTATYTTTAADVSAGQVTNHATATTVFGGAPVNSNPATTTVTFQSPGGGGGGTPAIGISKTPKTQTIASGTTATFTITVTNSGQLSLSNVTVSDPLAPACSMGPSQIAALGSMAPGASVTYNCALANVTASFTNVATATGLASNGQTVQATDTAAVTVTAPPTPTPPTPVPPATAKPSISIVKSPATQTVGNGGTATFQITVTNTGAVTLTNVTVSDPLSPDCSRNLGSLAAGEKKTYSCTKKNVSAGFENVANVTGKPPTGAPVGSTGRSRVKVGPFVPPPPPRISITKSPASQQLTTNVSSRRLPSGATQTTIHYADAHFTITVKNTGKVALHAVTVSDPTTPGCDRSIGGLGVGKSTTYRCTRSAVSSSFTNTATATGTAPTGGKVHATGHSTVTVKVKTTSTTSGAQFTG